MGKVVQSPKPDCSRTGSSVEATIPFRFQQQLVVADFSPSRRQPLVQRLLDLTDTRSYRKVGLVFVFSVRPDDHCKVDDFCDEASRVLC